MGLEPAVLVSVAALCERVCRHVYVYVSAWVCEMCECVECVGRV